MTSFNVIQPPANIHHSPNQMHEDVQHAQNVINDKRAVLASKNEKSLSIHEKEITHLNNKELISKQTVQAGTKVAAQSMAKVDNLHHLQEV